MMLALGIRYLAGYSVATDVADRTMAEWPPHPARVFMAMAAAYFETGKDKEEKKALEWLESQPPPSLRASDRLARKVVTHYVPVNDTGLPKDPAKLKPKRIKEGLSVLPYKRDKQPRTFPRVMPDDDTVYLLWEDSEPGPHSLAALERICGKVIRIGHSSSLVQMWVEGDPPAPNLLPDELGDVRLRIFGGNTLQYLKDQFNADAIDEYFDLQKRIAEAKGKEKRELKKQLTERFGDSEPVSNRPLIGLWQSYRREIEDKDEPSPASGVFDPNFIILSQIEGPAVGLETTWRLLTGLRDTILSLCDPVPEWVSGHKEDGTPSEQPHLALVPLPFVGHEHADGHLLGVGLVFPREIHPRERGRTLRNLLYDDNGRPKAVEVVLGKLGEWRFARETREVPPLALRNDSWNGPSRIWASVTPMVMDRHPKADYRKDRARWVEEASESIVESCARQGLPEPLLVDVDKTCWHRGSPRAIPGKGGYPLMPARNGQSQRQQVHVWIDFGQEVRGPLLLGAGRYRGYGMLKSWKGGSQ